MQIITVNIENYHCCSRTNIVNLQKLNIHILNETTEIIGHDDYLKKGLL